MTYSDPYERNANQRLYRRLNRDKLLAKRRGVRLVVLGKPGKPTGWLIERVV